MTLTDLVMCRWRELAEVYEPGVYMMMHKKELILNSTLIFVEEHPSLGLIRREYNHKDVEKDSKWRLHCAGNKHFLFYGPIPFPPKT